MLNFNLNAARAKASVTTLKIVNPILTLTEAQIIEPAPIKRESKHVSHNANTDFALDMIDWCNDVHDASVGQLMLDV